MTLRVAIVGGGITGLSAAYALAQHSDRPDVTLLEASGRLGGKVQTDHIGNLLVERGPDALFLRNAFALDFLHQLGLGDEVVRANPLHRETTILRNGHFHPLPQGMETGVPRAVWPMATTRLLSPWGKLRAAMEVAIPRDGVAGDESVDTFVRRRFGAEVAEHIAAPLLGSIYSSDTRELSVMATVPHLRSWEHEHGSLLLASWRGRLPGAGARNPAAPSPFISLRRGLSSLTDALRKRGRPAEVRLATRVTGLQPVSGGEGFALQLGNGEHLEADKVILATPAFVSANLLEPLSQAAAANLRAIRYASATVAALVFGPDATLGVPRGSGFLVARSKSSPLKACSWTSQKWPHCAPDGELLVRCHLRPDRVASDDASVIQAVCDELRNLIGLNARPLATRVYRWPRSVPSYGVGHLERVRAIDSALAEFPGLVLTGAGLRGVGIPECLRQGITAAEQAITTPARLIDHPLG